MGTENTYGRNIETIIQAVKRDGHTMWGPEGMRYLNGLRNALRLHPAWRELNLKTRLRGTRNTHMHLIVERAEGEQRG